MTVAPNRIEEIALIPDEDIDTSDIPEVGVVAFQDATRRLVRPTPQSSQQSRRE